MKVILKLITFHILACTLSSACNGRLRLINILIINRIDGVICDETLCRWEVELKATTTTSLGRNVTVNSNSQYFVIYAMKAESNVSLEDQAHNPKHTQ